MTKFEALIELEKCRKRRRMLKSRPYDTTDGLKKVEKRFNIAWKIAYPDSRLFENNKEIK